MFYYFIYLFIIYCKKETSQFGAIFNRRGQGRVLSQCRYCVFAVQCSRGTLSYIQSQCQAALSNLASDPETGAHRLLSLLPTTLQRCEEIHNEVGTAAAAAAAVTCSASDIPDKLFAAAPAVDLPWPCSTRQMTEICHVWTTEQRASEVSHCSVPAQSFNAPDVSVINLRDIM